MRRVEVADRLEHRAARRLHQLFFLRGHALCGSLDGPDEAVDARHHIARDHLIAAQLLLASGPVVPESEDGAEAARELLQTRDFLDRVVRCTDDRPAEFGHPLRCFIAVSERMALRAAEDAYDVLVLPSLEAVSDFAQRLLL